MEMFCDRDAVIKEKSPDGAWSLYIYGPTRYEDTRQGPQPHFYASFRKIDKDKYIAIPFGRSADPAQISIKWGLPGDICAIYIGEDCYALFNYGVWRYHSREFFRQDPEPPFSAEDIESVGKSGRLPEEIK